LDAVRRMERLDLRGSDRGRAPRARRQLGRLSPGDLGGAAQAQGLVVQRRGIRRFEKAITGAFGVGGENLSDQDPKQAIVARMRDFSIEATPHDAERLDEIAETLPPGTSVYMAHPPGVPIEDIVALAARLQKLGMQATPHIIARKLTSEAQLEGALASLQEAGVTQALVVGGDIAADPQAFEGSLEVLKTGLFGKYGFKRVGVAGHPEGSKAIGEPRVTQALEGKAAFAKDAGFDIYIATQFGFDPQAF